MIIVLKPEASEREVDHIIDRLRELGLKSQLSTGQERTIIGVIGDDRILHNQPLTALPGVESVLPILAPWKLVSREFKREGTVIDVSGVKIGGNKLIIMAGPCAVERLEITVGIAHEVKAAGASILRGGAYKPRTSPYSFQGLGREGLDYLVEAKKQTGLPVVSEILDTRDIELFLEKADIIQIGARNMQNFELLKEVGAYDKPVLVEAGTLGYDQGIPPVGRIHHVPRESERHVVRAGDQDLRDAVSQYARSCCGPDFKRTVAFARHRRSQPCHRQVESGGADVESRRGCGSGRHSDRSPFEPGMCAV